MRVAILGVGRLGAAHASTLRALDDVTELRVYDADPARAKYVGAETRAAVVDTVDAALKDVDAAVIVTPTETHAPIIRRCLDAGIATFCDKPIAIGITHTKGIEAHLAQPTGRRQVGFAPRYH